MSRSRERKLRHDRLLSLLEENPLHTDEDLAHALKASISTVRLDRALLGVPELRERMRHMAEKATSKLRSLAQDDVVGDLLELEPNMWALSVLQTGKEMAFRHSSLVWDHHIYAQASSLAMAVIGADMVVTGAARARYRAPVRVGDKLIARAKVGISKGNKYVVSVRTKVEGREIFTGRFIVVVLEDGEYQALEEQGLWTQEE
ncbi:MAG TPA: transcription factor FapR [Synergistaceae bacterium]|nr:transcription factor FapR [Synergistaceae bacterium]HQF91881.1 transcription factor FapR [Synergistaceae bacterium]HQK25110.1 transcription factor FapR [Synergistaceae bacterium]